MEEKSVASKESTENNISSISSSGSQNAEVVNDVSGEYNNPDYSPTAGDAEVKDDVDEEVWQAELEEDAGVDVAKISRQEYVNICDFVQNGLKCLLTNEMTNEYATFSLLFKKFRGIFLNERKILAKIHEIECLKRFLEKRNRELHEKLDKRDEKETELIIADMTLRNEIAETRKQKHDIEKQRDEMKQKIDQVPEEIFKAAAEFSLTTATEEKKLLLAQLDDIREKMHMLESDLKYSDKRASMFRSKYQAANSIQVFLKEEMLFCKRDLNVQIQMKENAELSIREKNNEIKKKLTTINHLKGDIVKLKEAIETEKEFHRKLFVEVQLHKKSQAENERTIRRVKTECAARQFQITVLGARKKNLEIDNQNKQHEIHLLKVELSKIIKERNKFSRSYRVAEEEFKRIKKDYDSSQQTVKAQGTEIEQLEKDKLLSETDYKDSIKQLMKLDYEYRLTKGVIREFETTVRSQEKHFDSVSKELQNKETQIVEMMNEAAKSRAEKNAFIQEITDLNKSVAEAQDSIIVLKQRCTESDDRIFHMKKEVKDAKDQYKFLNDLYRDISSNYKNVQRELEDIKYLNTMVSQRNKNQIVHVTSLQERQGKLDTQITSLNVDIKNARSALEHQKMRNSKLCVELRKKDKEKLCILKEVSQKEIEIRTVKRESSGHASEKEVLRTLIEEKVNDIKIKEEKICLQQQDLNKIELILHERVNDIRLLKIEIENLRRAEALWKSQKSDTGNLRVEIHDMYRQVMEEKLKYNTLSEFQKPQNVHRWRILEAEDPTRALLIAKNLKYQKDLVKKADKLKTKEEELVGTNRQISELQQDLKKLTDARSDKDLWTCKTELRESKERIKCLLGEISMYESLTNKQEIKIKELQNEINGLKVLEQERKLCSIKTSK